MTDNGGQANRTFTVDPAYWTRWSRIATLLLGLAVLLGVAAVIALVTGNGPLAAAAITLAVSAGIVGGLARRGATSTARARYELTVGVDGLLVVWRDQETLLPWTDLESATIVENGPTFRALEVRLRPGVRVDLPTNARPRPSKRSPGRLEVFIVSILGERQADCIREINRYFPIQ